MRAAQINSSKEKRDANASLFLLSLLLWCSGRDSNPHDVATTGT